MDEEILACIDEKNIKYLQSGQISKYIFPMPRKEAHAKKIGHLIIRFFGMTITPENEILYLVQKRSKNKNSFPLYFTDSASGHVEYQPKLEMEGIKENTLREIEEEFGIPPSSVKKMVFDNLHIEEDNFSGEIAYVFFGLIDHEVVLKPDPNELEIECSRFYNKAELEKLLKEEPIVPYTEAIWRNLLNSDIPTLFNRNNNKSVRKNNSIALFIGRFQPLHLGHIYVIENILKSCSFVKIGIGSSQLSNTINDPFTSIERRQFIESALEELGISSNKYQIFDIPDIFNAKRWVEHVESIVGDFDIMFSNSDWVRDLLQNKRYNIADKTILKMEEYNATNIRNLINLNDKNWKKLVPHSVITLMNEFGGIQRIQKLHKEEK